MKNPPRYTAPSCTDQFSEEVSSCCRCSPAPLAALWHGHIPAVPRSEVSASSCMLPANDFVFTVWRQRSALSFSLFHFTSCISHVGTQTSVMRSNSRTSQGLVRGPSENRCMGLFQVWSCKMAKICKCQMMKVIAHNKVSALVIVYPS